MCILFLLIFKLKIQFKFETTSKSNFKSFPFTYNIEDKRKRLFNENEGRLCKQVLKCMITWSSLFSSIIVRFSTYTNGGHHFLQMTKYFKPMVVIKKRERTCHSNPIFQLFVIQGPRQAQRIDPSSEILRWKGELKPKILCKKMPKKRLSFTFFLFWARI